MKKLVFFIVFILFLSACSSPTPVATTTPEETPPTEASAEAYPAPTVFQDPAYPEPEDSASPQPVASPSPLPDPGLETGHVTGILLQSGEPAANAILYLAEVIADDQGEERVASYDRVNSPKSVTDNQGNFAFTDIPPGKYGLVLDVVVSAYLLLDPETGEQFLFTISGGEITDLGELDHEDLPIP